MSEYSNVERPFLQKLKETHWDIIDQGTGIPQDPVASLRSSFNEVALKGEFIEFVGKINPWATGMAESTGFYRLCQPLAGNCSVCFSFC